MRLPEVKHRAEGHWGSEWLGWTAVWVLLHPEGSSGSLAGPGHALPTCVALLPGILSRRPFISSMYHYLRYLTCYLLVVFEYLEAGSFLFLLRSTSST